LQTNRTGSAEKKGTAQKEPPLIEFENVTVIRGGSRVLDAISLTLRKGENVAILGPNGAGKSSLIRTINRECYPIESDRPVIFKVSGRETWDVFEIRSGIGIVSNDLQSDYDRNIPVREAVISGFFSSIGLFMHTVIPAMEKRADELLRFLEIDHLADRPMSSLSSGEARRVLIARALVHNPSTLILDEPTNSLDISALHTFRHILKKIAASGTGIIMVTHNIHDIIPEITRVILMKDGKIYRDGKKAEIVTDENIRDLFGVTVQVREECGWYYATGY
jgi:iron complex transport system ATP-binding protein